jgi:hypothetical protein
MKFVVVFKSLDNAKRFFVGGKREKRPAPVVIVSENPATLQAFRGEDSTPRGS